MTIDTGFCDAAADRLVTRDARFAGPRGNPNAVRDRVVRVLSRMLEASKGGNYAAATYEDLCKWSGLTEMKVRQATWWLKKLGLCEHRQDMDPRTGRVSWMWVFLFDHSASSRPAEASKPEPCPASTISGQTMADRRGPLLHSTEDRVKVAADIDAIRASLVIERDDPSNAVELRDWYGLMAKMLDHTSLILAGNEAAIAFVHECHRIDREQQQAQQAG